MVFALTADGNIRMLYGIFSQTQHRNPLNFTPMSQGLVIDVGYQSQYSRWRGWLKSGGGLGISYGCDLFSPFGYDEAHEQAYDGTWNHYLEIVT